MIEEIIIVVLSFSTLIFGGKLLQLKKLVKEVKDIFPALDDVLTDQPGESQQDKIRDLKYLRTQCSEAFDALKGLFKK